MKGLEKKQKADKEKLKPLSEEIAGLEARLDGLLEKAGANMEAVDVEELKKTSKGQSKLLKLLHASEEFKDRVWNSTHSILMISAGAWQAGNMDEVKGWDADFAQGLASLGKLGIGFGLFWLWIKLFQYLWKDKEFSKKIRETLREIKGNQ